MPKQTIKIKQFEGGLNELQDARDIGPNQFSELDSVNIDDPGRIRLSGGLVVNSADTGYAADYTALNASMSSDVQLNGMIQPGYGLYQTTTDLQAIDAVDDLRDANTIRGTANQNEAVAKIANQLTLLGNGYTGAGVQNMVALYDHNADKWHITAVNLAGGTVSASALSRPLMYNLKGGIRISESNFNLTSTSKILQYIDRNHFDDGSHGNLFNGWFVTDQEISKNPESGHHPNHTDSATSLIVNTPDETDAVSATKQCQVVTVSWLATTNANAFGWNNSVTSVAWQTAISYIYDDGQESPLVINQTESVAVAASKNIKFKVYINANESTSVHLHPRLKGINLYVKGSSASSAQSNNWFLAGVFEFDSTKGGKRPQDDTWHPWARVPSEKIFEAETDVWASPPSVETFRTRTGRKIDEAVHARYKCAVEARGRMYIGNISQGEDAGDAEKNHPDRMLKSKRVSGKVSPDIFASSEMVDLANNDGEEITHLAYFMGKLLQFKQNTLYVVNVTGAMEALESTHKHIGITYPSQVVTTASGVLWVCKKGIMLYNGQSITNLIDGRISNTVWRAFFDLDSIPSVAYDANDAKVIICRGSEFATDKDVYIFDLKLKAFIFKKDALNVNFSPDSYLSNMITDFNGNIIVYNGFASDDDHATDAGSQMYKWSSSPQASSYFNMVTKDIDFEEPSIKKKMYKVYITYKCTSAASNVLVQYSVDGSKVFKQFATTRTEDMSTDFTTGGVTYAKLDGSKTVWTLAELRPLTSTEANNFRSVQLKISGDRGCTSATFTVAGSSYSAGTVTLTGGTGSGASATITVDGSGLITGVTDFTPSSGTGYSLGDILTVGGGDGAGRIQVTGLTTVPSDFEINDISIVYRGKRVK